MTDSTQPSRRPTRIALALYANAAILLGILLTLLFRASPGFSTAAVADQPPQQPIAGGAGVYVMPCQFHSNVWGCYLLDVDRQTLCAYEYRAGEKALTLTAARNFRYDLQLKNVGTDPSPYEIKKLVEEQDKPDRITGSKSTPAPPEEPKENR